MKIRLGQLCQPAAFTLVLCIWAGSLFAQYNGEMQISPRPPRGHFVTLPPRLRTDVILAATVPLSTWNGSFSYGGRTYRYNMVGSAPASNTSTTIPVYIIPVKVVITRSTSKVTFDPQHILSNGSTVVQNTVDSPLFDKTTTYTQHGVDVGTTQYIDAFQRANFWGTVKTHTNSHLLLGGPTVTAEQTLSPPSSVWQDGHPFRLYRRAGGHQLVRRATAGDHQQAGHRAKRVPDFPDL